MAVIGFEVILVALASETQIAASPDESIFLLAFILFIEAPEVIRTPLSLPLIVLLLTLSICALLAAATADFAVDVIGFEVIFVTVEPETRIPSPAEEVMEVFSFISLIFAPAVALIATSFVLTEFLLIVSI